MVVLGGGAFSFERGTPVCHLVDTEVPPKHSPIALRGCPDSHTLLLQARDVCVKTVCAESAERVCTLYSVCGWRVESVGRMGTQEARVSSWK